MDQCLLQGTRLESGTDGPAQMHDVDPERPGLRDGRGHDVGGLVVGVVEDLDLESLGRVVEPGDRLDGPLGYVQLVVDRQLHRHPGQGIG